MFHRLVDYLTPVASTNYQYSLRAANLDKLIIRYNADDHANGMTFAETDLVKFYGSYKRILNGVQKEVLFLEGARFEDLAKYTNGVGGLCQIPGTNCPTIIQAVIDLGQVFLKGEEELNLQVQFGAVGTLTNAHFSIYGAKTHNMMTPVKKYTSFNNQAEVNFRRVLECYSAGVSGALGTTTVIVNAGGVQYSVPEYIAQSLELGLGSFEEDESTATWELIFIDPNRQGTDISVRSDANTELFAVQLASW